MRKIILRSLIILFCTSQSSVWSIGRVWNSSNQPIVFSFGAAGCAGKLPWPGPSVAQCHWGLLGASHPTPITYDPNGKYKNGNDDENKFWWEDYSYTSGASARVINIGAKNPNSGQYDFCDEGCSYEEGNINVTKVTFGKPTETGLCTIKCEITNF